MSIKTTGPPQEILERSLVTQPPCTELDGDRGSADGNRTIIVRCADYDLCWYVVLRWWSRELQSRYCSFWGERLWQNLTISMLGQDRRVNVGLSVVEIYGCFKKFLYFR